MCRGGCTKDCVRDPRNENLNHSCGAYELFFAHADRQFRQLISGDTVKLTTSVEPAIVLCLILCFTFFATSLRAAPTDDAFAVVAYYHGGRTDIDRYPLDKLTHVIYSFLHLKGNRLNVNGARDSVNIARLVSLKKTHPQLKILVSLGGWGGCRTCSEVFSTAEGRREFAESTKDILQQFGADGIDLDWEYPAIQGYPGHPYTPGDKEHFTLLLKELRTSLGQTYELSFATGGFIFCLQNSIDWKGVEPYVDRINVMTYDLVNGNSTVTGHLTPLFSTPHQAESVDEAVRFLDSAGIPSRKIVIGAAFYARTWEHVDGTNHGLFQKGTFKSYVRFKDLDDVLDSTHGYVEYWDSTAQAPYRYNGEKNIFATFDDVRSVTLKTKYALKHHLGGIMFWELSGDKYENGLLDAIDRTKNER